MCVILHDILPIDKEIIIKSSRCFIEEKLKNYPIQKEEAVQYWQERKQEFIMQWNYRICMNDEDNKYKEQFMNMLCMGALPSKKDWIRGFLGYAVQLSCSNKKSMSFSEEYYRHIWETAYYDSTRLRLEQILNSYSKDCYIITSMGPGFYGMPVEQEQKLKKNLGDGYTGILVLWDKQAANDLKKNAPCKYCLGNRMFCSECNRKRAEKKMELLFLPDNKKAEVAEGITIMEASNLAGIPIFGDCSGRGTCGKCKVLVTKGNRMEYDAEELKMLTEDERKRGFHLACRFVVRENTCVLIPAQKQDMTAAKVSCAKQNVKGILGIAVDIGTTTIEAALCSVKDKQELDRISLPNLQGRFGADVISRLTYCYATEKEIRQQQMRQAVEECINQIIDMLLERQAGRQNYFIRQRIKSAVFAGNTVMSHFFLGKDIQGLAKAPFHADFQGSARWTNNALRLRLPKETTFLMLPNIGGQVGSDTTACIIAAGLLEKDCNCVLVDIGTNGEMVVKKGKQMFCASTAAGPAFEGAVISCGMRAYSGAIYKAYHKNETLVLETINNEKPEGICGSGIIDVLAELLREGIMDYTGRLLPQEEIKSLSNLASRVLKRDTGLEFVLYEDAENIISLTQKDIREIQMAKGAIKAGIVSLLKEAGLAIEDVDKFYLAGAFGSKIQINNAVQIGLLPDIKEEKYCFLGNAALLGAEQILWHEKELCHAEWIENNTEHIELADSSFFKAMFIQEMNF